MDFTVQALATIRIYGENEILPLIELSGFKAISTSRRIDDRATPARKAVISLSGVDGNKFYPPLDRD